MHINQHDPIEPCNYLLFITICGLWSTQVAIYIYIIKKSSTNTCPEAGTCKTRNKSLKIEKLPIYTHHPPKPNTPILSLVFFSSLTVGEFWHTVCRWHADAGQTAITARLVIALVIGLDQLDHRPICRLPKFGNQSGSVSNSVDYGLALFYAVGLPLPPSDCYVMTD